MNPGNGLDPRYTFRGAAALAAGLITACGPARAAPDLSAIRLPEGFAIEVFVPDLPKARSMTIGDNGTVFVGTRKDSRVWAVRTARDPDGGFRALGEPVVIASGLDMPNGVAFHDGGLFVAEVSRISFYPDIENRLEDPPPPLVIRDDYPTASAHGWRYIAMGPDGKLYVPIGAPCNICEEEGFAVITRIDPDGSGREVFALAPGHRRDVVHRQRPGLDGR
jgi:glucose/arabinose dehydrogenase